MKSLFLLILIASCWPSIASSQNIEKIIFDPKDSTGGYYLAVRPLSNQGKGAVVLLTSFLPPEQLLPETKLHNVASGNDMLAIIAFMKGKLYADSAAVDRLNLILKDVAGRFSVDTSKFVLAGYEEAGTIALRYTEMTYEHPSRFPVQPKAVFGIDCPVDLFGLWHWSEKQIRKNYWPGAVGDARYYLDVMKKELGTVSGNPGRYGELSPFNREADSTGNERYLENVAVRLYYDTDIGWQLRNRRNSFYDTKMADGSELIKRLLLSGNDRAEFISSRQPGLMANGTRTPSSPGIVDEVDCMQWIKKSLDIFDPNNWVPPYDLATPQGWSVERFSLPPGFAPQFTCKGVEDLRFAPGWGNSDSEDYWSYAYVWWLDGQPGTDAATLQNNLKAYYTGLVGQNIERRKIPENKLVPVVVTVKKIRTAAGDTVTYNGEVHMLDYMAQRPIVLNVLIHVKNDPGQKHTPVFVEISPRPFSHPIWEQMNSLEKGFQVHR